MSLLGGEVQESEILLPMVSQRYKVELDRTRSYYIPKMPFEVKVSFSLVSLIYCSQVIVVKLRVSHLLGSGAYSKWPAS